MSSASVNIDKSLELIQKTYNLQITTTTTTNNYEISSQIHSSNVKVSTHQPLRKTSVHDIHEVTKHDLQKIFGEIQDNLSRLKSLLETMNSVEMIRDDFFKLKEQLFNKVTDFIYKLANETGKRGSIISKGSSSTVSSNYPQNLVYCIEYFRNELAKAEYLFSSLTLSAAIGSATLDNINIQSFSISNIDQKPENHQDMKNFRDLIQIKKDISILEEHAYVLNQRYYSQIPDWHELDDTLDKGITTSGTLIDSNLLNTNRLRIDEFNKKFSARSSITSNENSSFCANFYQKCQIICCICRPNYL
ncbi:unnamed protein product [Rotaria magnacalcarata]|uniref:Uncharacterized protein n=1 Tax=Rotaria magnacalcarata TaxID=392030 RepID=A0A816PVG6_9BILA|nr:unnamed protein product [Rotaria magnacalcarata]CAF1593669.1 unnamed protein product [Rotaria magnacalcarata]CAF2053294.1 unnamed protein product [Rotaria magnacalcarata]CAF2053884.1 unnamed protein product [Rotaria magnacalcarata]CAF2197783.1 unnamed protein product [Rotaria magnacalcarata]